MVGEDECKHLKKAAAILDSIMSLYAHDSADVRSTTLFALLLYGLEQHLMETLGHDMSDLSGTPMSPLAYADDIVIMLCKCEMPQEFSIASSQNKCAIISLHYKGYNSELILVHTD